MLSIVTFLELILLGFGGSFVTEVMKDDSNEVVIFWSSMFSFILIIFIVYIYITAFEATRSEK